MLSPFCFRAPVSFKPFWGAHVLVMGLSCLSAQAAQTTVPASVPPSAAVPASAAPRVEPSFPYTLTGRDTLITLGRRFLAEPEQWPQLQAHNQIRDPRRMKTGSVLQIPLRLMVTEPVPAQVVAASGDVRGADGQVLAAGQTVPQGGSLRTGESGQAIIKLVDGTVLKLRPSSAVQLDASQRVPKIDGVMSGVKVQEGQVEVKANKVLNGGLPGFRVSTPQGLLGVRGTEFRVAVDGGAEVTRNEVLEGQVAADGHSGKSGQRVNAGFGVVVDRTGDVPPPVKLLGAPDVSALPKRHEKVLVRFAMTPQPGAVAYRGQVAAAADSRFEQVLKDVRTTGTELRFADLPDGDYLLRVRAEDVQGLQGLDALHPFTLKARPEPPLPSTPAPRAILSGTQLDFAWANAQEANTYRLQLAQTEDFRAPLQDRRGVATTSLQVEGLTSGVYYWRLASERSPNDQGPFGAVQRVELRPAPKPLPAPSIGEGGVRLSWEGLPGQTFDIEFARDASFTALELARKTQEPLLEVTMPGTGRYFMRLRAHDPDGFIGPYTAPQQFNIPNCLRDGHGRCTTSGDGTSVLIGP